MREITPVAPVTSLAADESLAYVRQVENLSDQLDNLHRHAPGDRAAIGRANQRLGVAMKLAEVHANLAVAEQLIGLRTDIARPEQVGREVLTMAGGRCACGTAGCSDV